MDERGIALLGDKWFEMDELKRLTTTSLIDHALLCQRAARMAVANELRGVPRDIETRVLVAARYEEQVTMCLSVLQLRGVYEADPHRDTRYNLTWLD